MFMTKTGRTKLLANHHTGKVRAHKHTSYGSLVVILLLTFLPLLSVSHKVSAASTDSVSDNYGTYAVVPGPVPKTAPVISGLKNGTVYTVSDPILVKGSCPGDTLVKIFKNEVMAGATLCQKGQFEVSIDLFVGSNTIIARAYNTNNIASPDSVPVLLQFLPPGTDLKGTNQLNPLGAPAGQFYITSDISHRGANVGDNMTWPLTLSGGQPPYALSISWGDGKTDLISRGYAGRFDINHSYAKAAGYRGSYTIVIRSTDSAGNKSYLQLAAIVSGDGHPAGVIGIIRGGSDRSAVIKIAWQLLAVAVIVVLSFWLGEKREEHLIKSPAKITA